jgi:hypothetical protein
MSGHTPGPWRIEDGVPGDMDIAIVAGDPRVEVYEWAFVAHVCGPEIPEDVADAGGFDRAEALANARVIAAAPDLLEAARVAAQFILNGIEMGYITMPEPGDSALMTRGLIVAAIAKAEGRVTLESLHPSVDQSFRFSGDPRDFRTPGSLLRIRSLAEPDQRLRLPTEPSPELCACAHPLKSHAKNAAGEWACIFSWCPCRRQPEPRS